MGVKGLIILQKPRGGVFRSGEPVKGILKYSLDKPMTFTSITLCLVGKGKCQWSGPGANNRRTYYRNKEEYVNATNHVPIGRFNKNILTGTYDYPFEIFLPEGIPTSFKNNICTIKYKIVATFVRDNFFGTKNRFEAEVTVYGYVERVSPEPLIFGLQKDLFALASSHLTNIEVKAQIEKTFLTPGENIILKITVVNDTDVPITIKTELMKYLTYVSDNKIKNINKETVKTTTSHSPTIKRSKIASLTCVVPTLPSLFSIQHTKVMIGEYKVKVTAKLPFPHVNASVEIPVVIGERRDHLGATVVGFDDGSPSSSKTPSQEENEPTVAEFFEEYDKKWQDMRAKMS